MNLARLFIFALAACGLSSSPAAQVGFEPTTELGNIMYVGDSITHGVDSASYRWPLFKIWVDNGISHTEVGVNSGNWRGGVARDTPYGGSRFLNIHSAISSQRAYEIAGRINQSGRLENTNIRDWLGLDTSYTGKRRINPDTQMPDTFILLIGTNDTLSDAGKAGIHSCVDDVSRNLLGAPRAKGSNRGRKNARTSGDMSSIISSMREANPRARIAVCTIPCWMDGRNNNNAPEDFAAIARYNSELKSWGRAQGVAVVDVNRGLTDVARAQEKPFVGVPSMFVRDRLHPSPQGDLIIAGNIAQQLGYAGRTAGLPRKAARELPQAWEGRAAKPGTCVELDAPNTPGQGATVVLTLRGKTGNWRQRHPISVMLTAADGSTGHLSVDAHGILWGQTLLYAAEMSRQTAPIRLARVPANAQAGIPGGFYVWLGDMLIGEALSGSAEQRKAGVELVMTRTGVPVCLRYDPAAAWAPETTRATARP